MTTLNVAGSASRGSNAGIVSMVYNYGKGGMYKGIVYSALKGNGSGAKFLPEIEKYITSLGFFDGKEVAVDIEVKTKYESFRDAVQILVDGSDASGKVSAEARVSFDAVWRKGC